MRCKLLKINRLSYFRFLCGLHRLDFGDGRPYRAAAADVEFHFVARSTGADVRLSALDVDVTTDEFCERIHDGLSLKILS